MLVLLFTSCSQYSHRMTRVKPRAEVKTNNCHFSSNAVVRGLESKSLVQGFGVDDQLRMPIVSKGLGAAVNSDNIDESGKIEKEKAKFLNKFRAKVQEPPSEEFLKQKYERANKLSFWALGLLLISPFAAGLTLIAAIVVSAIAVKICFKYENPGVTERYTLALAVLVLSSVILLVVTGLLV